MKTLTALTASIAVLGSALAVSVPAAAQSYGSGDICRQEQRRQANTGTVAGGVLGAVIGSQVAGRGAKTEGAVLGGAVGAVAGHQIAKSRVRCGDYPRNIRARRGCQWVHEGGRSFELCRGRDGAWRPSGR
jgi:uncharacterized membrane protein